MTNYLAHVGRCVMIVLLLPSLSFAEKVILTWNAVNEPAVIGYRLSYGTTPGVHPTTVDVGNQTGTALTGLQPGQRYYFVVRAYSVDAESLPSDEASGVAVGVVALT